jgi:hypothetical protein
MKDFIKAFLFISITAFILTAICFVGTSNAQDIPRFAFGGIGYFGPATPNVKAYIGMAIPITSDHKAKSWTDADFSIVKSGGQLAIAGQRLQYEIKTGIEYDIFSRGSWTLMGLGAPGVRTDGNITSAMFSYGGGLHKWVHKDRLGLMLLFTAETGGNQAGKIETNFAPRIGVTFKF